MSKLNKPLKEEDFQSTLPSLKGRKKEILDLEGRH